MVPTPRAINPIDTTGDAPLLTATFGPKKVPAKWGKFGTSNVWAAQGNTIPATFWTMAYVMASPGNWLRRCQEECRAVFAGLPDAPKHPAWKGSWADASNLEKMIPITSACFMEALRLKGTGAEFRVVLKDHVVTSGGKEYFLREGQELYNSSYFMHHSDKVYDDPEQFRPERWLEEEAGEGSFSTGGKKVRAVQGTGTERKMQGRKEKERKGKERKGTVCNQLTSMLYSSC